MPHVQVVEIVEAPLRNVNLCRQPRTSDPKESETNSWFIQHLLSNPAYSPNLYLARVELPLGLSLLSLVSFSFIVVL